MGYNRSETINHYFLEIDSQRVTFSEMRPDLEKKNLDPAEIGIVINQVDKQLQRADKIRGENSMGKNLYYGGITVSVGGIILTAATYLGFIDTGHYFIIAYGPIFFGAVIAFIGKAKMNRK